MDPNIGLYNEALFYFLLKGSGLIELLGLGLLMHLSPSLGPLGMGGDINENYRHL